MSLEIMPSERVCYVDCNFCNTILAVSVPCSSLFNIVTVRCGHCANLLSVNVGASVPQEDPSHQIQKQIQSSGSDSDSGKVDSGSSSSKCNKFAALDSHADQNEQPRLPPIRPPEKRQRVPSAYNKFIKEEIQRIKASNPDISHRQAFSTAAKNWAHFPHMHFQMKQDGNKKQANSLDHQPIAGSELASTTQKSTLIVDYSTNYLPNI